MTTYTRSKNPDLRIQMSDSVLDLRQSDQNKERSTVRRTDLEIAGDTMRSIPAARKAQMSGNVKMVITGQAHSCRKAGMRFVVTLQFLRDLRLLFARESERSGAPAHRFATPQQGKVSAPSGEVDFSTRPSQSPPKFTRTCFLRFGEKRRKISRTCESV